MKLLEIFLIFGVFPRFLQSKSHQNPEWGVIQEPLDLIVGGTSANARDFPWHASIFHKTDEEWEYKCGGSLISEQFVLTVKHCTVEGYDPLPVEKVLIKFGLQNYKCENENSQNRTVSKMYYVKGTLWEEFRNDIALIKLVNEVEISPYVLPVLLVEKEPAPETMGTVVGFGFTHENKPSESLRKLEMPTIDTRQCTFRHSSFKMDLGQLCAGFTDYRTACNGDSGGGMVFRKKGKFYLGAIVSYSDREDGGYTCRLDGYSVLTSVYYYLLWINRITNLNVPVDGPFSFNNIPCGVSKIKRFRRIVGGEEAIPGQWPWHANIYHAIENRKEYVCGGALINERFILSARQCISEQGYVRTMSVTRIFVQLGVQKLDNSNREYYDIKKIYTPATTDDSISRIDIALLELSNEVIIIYTNIVRPVCLPDINVEVGLIGTLIGFGFMEDDKQEKTLRMSKMPIINALKCLSHPGNIHSISENNFCTGHSNVSNVCLGDAGGGIYFKREDYAWYIGGITSFPARRGTFHKCALDDPTIFTDVFKNLPWINSVISSNS